MNEFRAVQGLTYERHWKFQKKTWFGWRTVHTEYCDQNEAQKKLDYIANGHAVLRPAEGKSTPHG